MVCHGVGVRAATPTVRGMRAIQSLQPSSTIRSRANMICGRIQFLLKSELHQISSPIRRGPLILSYSWSWT